MMNRLLRLIGPLAFMFAGWNGNAAAATLATAVTINSVNLRAGPALQYPVVVVMPASVSVATYGCLPDMSWCDVGWNGQRGWVSSPYLRVMYQQQPVAVTAGTAAAIGITIAVFNQAYWQHHYVGRPWYASWPRYAAYAPVTVHRGLTACNGNGCGHVSKTYGVLPAPVVNHAGSGCHGIGCAHVMAAYGPASPPGAYRRGMSCPDGSCNTPGRQLMPSERRVAYPTRVER
ncbi:SH3 domain-containing protein [Xanthomonas axonopodis pv. ricini]|nr:SH3 domain-containing protein [Xanthomonas euvesicatoria]